MSYGRKAKVEAGEAVPLRCKLPRLPVKEGMQMNRARAEEYRSLHEASCEAARVLRGVRVGCRCIRAGVGGLGW
jgi:hypothetical protein